MRKKDAPKEVLSFSSKIYLHISFICGTLTK